MNPVHSILESLKPVLLTASVLLLLAGCGKDTPAPVQDSPAAKALQSSETPDVLPDTLKIKLHEKTYVITGIGLSGSNKVAIINNQVVRPGMEVDPGVVVEDVQPTYAIIAVGNTRHLLRPEDIQRELDRKRR